MDSVRSFVRWWMLLTVFVLAYAWADLRFSPGLAAETQLSLEPDLERLHDLVHWGGRLLNHGAVPLLVANALLLSGIATLLLRGAVGLLRRVRRGSSEPRVSIVPSGVPTSVPPPGRPSV